MSKHLFRDFGQTLERRYSREYAEQSMLQWVMKNTTLRGMPYSVAGYEFQEAIINDMHPNLSCIKCSQVGLTEAQIRKILGFCVRNRGVSAIFSLPEEKLFRRISQTRVKPIVDKDKIFNLEQDAESVRSMGIMQFGSSFLYITGCTEGDATSTAADAVFNDEVDLSDQEMLALFNSRLQNSNFKIKQGFSTPTFIGYGIDGSYAISDQKHWLYKCSACNHWNWPEFDRRFFVIPDLPGRVENLFELKPEDIEGLDITKSYMACEDCGAPLGYDDLREWVPKFPSRTHSSGYHVTPFTTTRLSFPYVIGQLFDYRKKDFLRGFYNTVLGLPYSDSNTQIPESAIKAAFAKGSAQIVELPKDRQLAIGIDVGDTCHVVVGDAQSGDLLMFRQVPASEIEEFVLKLTTAYNIVAGAIDKYPYTPTAEKIRDRSNGVILPVEYAVRGVDFSLVVDEYDNLSHAKVVRTKVLDLVANGFKEFSFSMNGYGHQQQIITEHLRDMVRDESPEKPAVWKKLTGNDHYFHAIGYYIAALKLRPLVIEHQNQNSVGSMFTVMKANVGPAQSNIIGVKSKRTAVLGAERSLGGSLSNPLG